MPEQQRRRRSVKSARTTPDDSSQPPLTALQRLSLARKASSPLPSNPPVQAITSSSIVGAVAESGAKPISKLALLAQKRKEAAQVREQNAASRSNVATKSFEKSIPVELSSKPEKTLSKLAQKMAATRIAWAESIPVGGDGDMEIGGSENTSKDDLTPPINQDDDISGLFCHINGNSTRPPELKQAPSPFFGILTSTLSADSTPSDTHLITNLHLPMHCDPAEYEERMRKAFGPGVDSPDDAVLRARQGRVGIVEPGLKPSPVAKRKS